MRGRKKIDDSKSVRVDARLASSENDKLDFLSFKTGLSRSGVIRKAINLMYNLEKSKE